VRLIDDKRRTGALAQLVRQPPAILDVGVPEVAMTYLVGPTHALDPNAHGRRPHAPARDLLTAESSDGSLSSVSRTFQFFRILAGLTWP